MKTCSNIRTFVRSSFLVVLLALALASSASLAGAQSNGHSERGTGAIAGTQLMGAEVHLGPGACASETGSSNFLFHPLGVLTPFQLSYYDSTLDSTEWIGHGLYNPILLVSLGERFTLPANSGFVDSVTLQIDSITTDSVVVALVPDTLIDIGGGTYFHLMNIFGLDSISHLSQLSYSRQTVQSDNVRWGVPTTVHFPHVAVPQSFFVAVIPNISSDESITNAFWWRGDHEAQQQLTTDNARSAFTGGNTQTGQYFSSVFGGTFISQQGDALFMNFYATLYGSAGSAAVPVQLNSAHEAALYPNPATAILNIPSSLQALDFELRDILGRTVLRSSEKNPRLVDVSSLASGNYWAFIHTAGGIITAPVAIAR